MGPFSKIGGDGSAGSINSEPPLIAMAIRYLISDCESAFSGVTTAKTFMQMKEMRKEVSKGYDSLLT